MCLIYFKQQETDGIEEKSRSYFFSELIDNKIAQAKHFCSLQGNDKNHSACNKQKCFLGQTEGALFNVSEQ